MTSGLRVGNLDDLLEWLGKLNTSDFRWELKKLHALREWAFERAGIDYVEGDKVRLDEGFRVQADTGWWCYRECLVPGAVGTAVEIDFSPHHMMWIASFRPDREWTVSEYSNTITRHWHGPIADTPEGYEPPTKFCQDQYPEGRRHTFMMRAEELHHA